MADMYSKEEFERRKRKGSLTPLPEVSDEDEVELPATLPIKLTAPTPAEKAAVVETTEKKAVENKIAEQLNLPKLEVPKTTAEPAAPKLKKAEVASVDVLQKSLQGVMDRFAEDRQLTEEQRKGFERRQNELQGALSDAKAIYEKSVDKATSAADRREAITQWASIATSFSQAVIKYFAAREGARTGMLLGSKLQFEKYDWQKDLDRSLEKLKADTSEAKTRLGIAREDVEAQAKQLGEERKTAVAEREDIARQRAGASEKALLEDYRARQRANEQIAEEHNKFLREQEQAKRIKAETEAKEQKAATKEEAKTIAQIDKAYTAAVDDFTTGFESPSAKRATHLGNLAANLQTLGATSAEAKRLEDLMAGTYGQFDATDKAEAMQIIAGIKNRKLSSMGAAPAAAQTSGQQVPTGDTVTLEDTKGERRTYPRSYLQQPVVKKALESGQLKIVGQ